MGFSVYVCPAEISLSRLIERLSDLSSPTFDSSEEFEIVFCITTKQQYIQGISGVICNLRGLNGTLLAFSGEYIYAPLMSAFSHASFSSNNYLRFRPKYPTSLFDALLKYHQRGTNLAVDLGCGPGEATEELAGYFDKVIGTDVSQKMIEEAAKTAKRNVVYEVASADKLSHIENNSIDMVTAAECAHWLKADSWFEEMYRVLAPNGTLAYWCYVDPEFPGLPRANDIYTDMVYNDKDWIGGFWQEPGRTILRQMYKPINEAVPKQKFRDIETSRTALDLRKKLKVEELLCYIETYSAFHKWASQRGVERESFSLEFMKRLNQSFGWTENTEVEVAWQTSVTMMRRI